MRKAIIYGAASVLNATVSTLGIRLEDFVIPWWVISAMWAVLLTAAVFEFGPGIRRRWMARRGKRNGPVIQYWHQSGWDALFKLPRYPKVVRMRDTGEIMEWSHPNPDYQKPKDHK